MNKEHTSIDLYRRTVTRHKNKGGKMNIQEMVKQFKIMYKDEIKAWATKKFKDRAEVKAWWRTQWKEFMLIYAVKGMIDYDFLDKYFIK